MLTFYDTSDKKEFRALLNQAALCSLRQMMEQRCIEARKAGLTKSLNTISNSVGDRVTLGYSQPKTSSLITSTCSECQLSLPYRSNSRISKRITSFDEEYLSHCLELIQIGAAKAVNFSVTWSPSKASSPTEISFPSPRNVSAFSSKRGSETRSKSMILRSPLFKHSKACNDNNSEAFSFPSVRASLESYCDVSPSGFSFCSSRIADMESGERKHGSDNVTHKDSSQYTSSIVCTSSDRSSCIWPAISHATLQCTQRNGITHFVFSMDNKSDREVYTSRSSKSALSDGSSLDWIYFIHLSKSNHKEHNVPKIDSDLVGRINVSTSYEISTDGSKIMETEFVLYSDIESQEGELDKSSSSHDTRKRRRLPGKVSNFFKPLHLPKHRFKASRWGTSTSIDLTSSMPEQEDYYDSDYIGRPNLLEREIPSNFELTAIVVKEQVEVVQQEKEVGGWGLRFLKRATQKPATDCRLGRSAVKRSMDVIIPAGYHGGLKTGNARPSCLIERWRKGGQCDCGGWDTGCPLTLLDTISDNEERNIEPQSQGVSKSLDLFLKGGKGSAPSMKMVNIQNGLYCIDFESRLSPLQSFSIAVAVIHSRSPTLQPNTPTC